MKEPTTDFEKSILELYDNVSSIPFSEFHKHMQDYVDVLRALKENKPNAMDLNEAFLNKTFDMPFKDVGYAAREDIDFNFTDELAKYKKCPLWFTMEKGDKGGAVSTAFSIEYISDEYLFNQIVFSEKESEQLKYTIGFDKDSNITCFGLELPKCHIEQDYIERRPYSITDIVRFPESSPFVDSEIDLRDYRLETVRVYCNFEIEN